jgi:adenine-specific DNA-methyltransferase
MYIARYIPKSGKNKGQKIDLLFMGKQKVLLIWLKDTAVKKEGVIFKREKIGTYWDGFSWINVTKEGSIKFDNGKKPIALIQQMIDLIPDNEKMIVLDFFSGSASTAHAVLQNNATNDTHSQQRFIMIQLPEVIRPVTKDNLSYIDYLAEEGIKPVITEIGKERIRRAGEKIKGEAGLFAGDLDIGFKVFKLDSSNLKKWNPDYDDIEKSMYDSVDNYVDGRTEMDVVYEIMIKMGIELTQPVEERTIAGRKVYSVGKGALMMCLDDDITTDVAHGIVELKEEYSTEKDAWNVVFKDNGFASDSAKTNIKEIFKCADLKEDAFTTV